jgi:hypothetical protein
MKLSVAQRVMGARNHEGGAAFDSTPDSEAPINGSETSSGAFEAPNRPLEASKGVRVASKGILDASKGVFEAFNHRFEASKRRFETPRPILEAPDDGVPMRRRRFVLCVSRIGDDRGFSDASLRPLERCIAPPPSACRSSREPDPGRCAVIHRRRPLNGDAPLAPQTLDALQAPFGLQAER